MLLLLLAHTRRVPRAQSLKHENVVGFYGAFEIDHSSFATVLEYCRGPDLDARLRQAGTLSEKEARLIVQYILRALYYLNNVRACVRVAVAVAV